MFALPILLAACAGAESVAVTFAENRQVNYERQTHIETFVTASGASFVVSRTDKSLETGTAWRIASDRMMLPVSGGGYAVSFAIRADSDWKRPNSVGNWANACRFYDAEGKLVAERLLDVDFRKGDFVDFLFSGRIPPRSRAMEICFGIDMRPAIKRDGKVEVRNLALKIYGNPADIPPERGPDYSAPVVTSDFESPSTDCALRVRYGITDATGVDWSSVAVTNSADKEAIPFVRDGEGIVLRPGMPWSPGCHRIEIAVRDSLGNAAISRKAFLIGEAPKTRKVALRDDGVTLVEGRPFYPIGIYGIKPHEFNGGSFGIAIAGLRAAGFNSGHSYKYRWDADFLTAAATNGMALWTDGKCALNGDREDWFLRTGRGDPATLAWYIGDDTSMNTTPQQLLDRDEACRMLDGTRITCHADGVAGRMARDNFQDYVRYADVFMPELYPIDGTKDETCVAEICRDMDRCRDDIVRFGDPRRPCAVWAILQCFHGKTWKRYPTAAEMYAMGFAAVIHGANGMLWFHYGGDVTDPKKSYSGIFRTQEDWNTMTNLVLRIREISPILLERTPQQPPQPSVVSGPAADPFGQPSVTALLKEHRGCVYLFAVNAANEGLRARFRLGKDVRSGEVLWENRNVTAVDGAFEDDFTPFGVHVYRFKRRDR